MATMQRKPSGAEASSSASATPVARSTSASTGASATGGAGTAAAAAAPPATLSRAESAPAASLPADLSALKLSELPIATVRASASATAGGEFTERVVRGVAVAPAALRGGPVPGPLMGLAPTAGVHRGASMPVAAIHALQPHFAAGGATTPAAPKLGLVGSGPRVLVHHHTPSGLSAATASLMAAKSLPGSAKASGVRLAKPACVPAPPFFLTAFLVHLSASVPLPVLKATVESALKAADVDYEYNDAKWKAKCFLYRTCGNCSFVLRLYTTGGGAGPDAAPGMTTPTGAQQATSPAALLQPLTAASLSGRAPATTTSSFPSLPSLGSSAPAPALPAVAPAAAAAAATNSSGAETFLIELQRRKGCGHLFRRTYDRLVTHFAAAKLLPADCPAAARARALGLLPAGVERPLGAPAASAADVVPVVPAARDFAGGAGVDCPPPHTVLADRRADGTGYGDDDADEDDDDGVSGGEEAPTTLASGTTTGTGSARDPRGVLDAFASLAALLGSDYDDISAPAAQSIASLSTSRKMRRVVGEAAAAGAAAAAAAAATGASSRARSSGSDSAATTPAASPSHAASAPSTTPAAAGAAAAATTAVAAATAADAQSAAAAALLQTLLNRAVFQRASTECRTSAALSLASFARDARCAEALATLNAGAVLLTAAALVPLSAPTAALRRELVRAVLNMTLAAPATARAAVREPAVIHLRTYALMRPPFAGVDHAFDAVVRRLEEVLTPVAREVGAPMQITVQAAAGATVATVQQQQQQLQLQQQAASPATTPVAAAAAAAARGGRAM